MKFRSAVSRAVLALGLIGTGAATVAAAEATGKTESVILAGGCFWCVESDFDKVPGVLETVSGYAGGSFPNPTYERHPGHREVVRITYDPAKVTFPQLV